MRRPPKSLDAFGDERQAAAAWRASGPDVHAKDNGISSSGRDPVTSIRRVSKSTGLHGITVAAATPAAMIASPTTLRV